MTNVLVLDVLNCAFTLKHVKEKDPLWRFITDIRNIISANKIQKCILATDTGQSQFRLSMYPQYKETRRARRASATDDEKKELQEFFEVVNQFKDMAPLFGMEVATVDKTEADDIVAYFAINSEVGNYKAHILSSDTDLFQLLRPTVVQRSYAEKMKLGDTDIPPQIWITEDRFKEVFQMTPAQYMEAKSISGDTGDSIYSPEGVGKETGFKLIRKYGSISEVEKNVDELEIPRFSSKGREALKKDFWMVHRNVELVSLLHTPETFQKIFGEGLSKLEDILARVDEPPKVNEEALKEYLFATGRVNVYYDFDNWVRPFYGR